MRQHVKTEENNRRLLTEALFHRHAPTLFAYLRQQQFSREDAEDLLLEIFTAMLEYKRLEQLSPDQQRGLLWRIAHNKSIDSYRRKKKRPSVAINLVGEDLLVDTEQIPESEIVRMEEYSRLRAFPRNAFPGRDFYTATSNLVEMFGAGVLHRKSLLACFRLICILYLSVLITEEVLACGSEWAYIVTIITH